MNQLPWSVIAGALYIILYWLHINITRLIVRCTCTADLHNSVDDWSEVGVPTRFANFNGRCTSVHISFNPLQEVQEMRITSSNHISRFGVLLAYVKTNGAKILIV